MALVVEYLLIVRKADTFCASADAFTELLNIDSSIEIEGGKARFGDFECDYAVTSGDIEAKHQRFFHVRFSTSECETQEQIDKFSALLKVVRSVMNKVGGQPETLWDDISFHYSKDVYKLIYRVENLMRKLIANFMLVTVGAEWIDESAPKEVKEAIGKSKRKEYLNVLHTVDFIQLADFLLRPYSNTSSEELQTRIKNAQTVEDLTALKACISQSNWSRYFSALVECDDGYLKKRWEELYELRCKVAHNAIVNKSDFERVQALVNELEGKLENAINKLPQVKVPEAEVEQVAEHAASGISELMGEFVSAWRVLEGRVIRGAGKYNTEPLGLRVSFRRALDILRRNGVLEVRHCERAMLLSEVKNHLVHPTGVSLSPEELRSSLRGIRALAETLAGYEESGTGERGCESSIGSADYHGSSSGRDDHGDFSGGGYSYDELLRRLDYLDESSSSEGSDEGSSSGGESSGSDTLGSEM